MESETSWRQYALCTQVDSELFFPDARESNKDARRVCAACPVSWECQEYAISMKERHGIWGGKTTKELAAIRLQRQAHQLVTEPHIEAA